MNIINEITSKITDEYSYCYKNRIIEKDRIGFSLNDDRIGRTVSVLLEYKNGEYIANGYETSQIPSLSNNRIRSETKKIKSSDEFWKWYSNFYNDLH
jgi:Trm5-related predicted tRNA methylase